MDFSNCYVVFKFQIGDKYMQRTERKRVFGKKKINKTKKKQFQRQYLEDPTQKRGYN